MFTCVAKFSVTQLSNTLQFIMLLSVHGNTLYIYTYIYYVCMYNNVYMHVDVHLYIITYVYMYT